MKHHLFSKRSRENLKDVKPEIVGVVCLALKLSQVDFTVIDGARTIVEQIENFNKGVSKTMNSMHLIQEDDFAHAVDIIPCGFKTFDEITDDAWYQVHIAIKQACRVLAYPLHNGFDMWGWDKPHWQDNS